MACRWKKKEKRKLTSNFVSFKLVTSSALSLRHNLKFCDRRLHTVHNNLTYCAVCVCGIAPCIIRVVCLCLSICWTRSNRTYPRAQVPTPDCHLAIPTTAHCCISLQHRAHCSPSCTRLCKHLLSLTLNLLAPTTVGARINR